MAFGKLASLAVVLALGTTQAFLPPTLIRTSTPSTSLKAVTEIAETVEEKVLSPVEVLKTELAFGDDKISFLEKKYGPITGAADAKGNTPDLQTTVPAVVDFFKNVLEMKDEHIASVIMRCPFILGADIDNMKRVCVFLAEDVGIDKFRALRIAYVKPEIFFLDHREDLLPLYEYLRYDLGMKQPKIGKLLRKDPKLFSFNWQEKFVPAVDFLTKDIGLTIDRARHVIKKNPAVLRTNVDKQLRPAVEALNLSGKQLHKKIEVEPMLLTKKVSL